MMRYLSVCSGIEAASCAWEPLGWEPLAFSEIEDFPRAVLRHRFPNVPLHGDFTVLRDQPWIVDADLLVGGTPCQAFSVAGLRRSLKDNRGNLTLEFVRLADAIDDLRRDAGRPPAWIVWENVPGVLGVGDNAFGAFLAGLVGHDAPIEPPSGLGWTYAGVVSGPKRVAAWRVLDAQHFGVAQRRRRVFLLALGGSGGWACADALLPVAESLRGHPPPRREAGKGTAHGLTARAGNSSRPAGSNGNLIPDIAPTLDATMDRKWGSNQWVDSGFGIVEPVVMSSGQANAEIRTDGGAPYLTCLHEAPIIAHALTGNGFDASKDGTGRGTPIVPVHAFDARQSDVIQYGDMAGPLDTDGHSQAVVTPVMGAGHGGSNGAGIGSPGDPAFTLDTCGAQAIAFSCKDHGADAGEISPTLRAMGHGETWANGGGQVAVAFDILGTPATEIAKGTDVHTPLRARMPGQLENSTVTVVVDGVAAFDTTQITSAANRSNPQPGDPCHPLAAGAHAPAVALNGATEFLPQSSRVYGDGDTSPTLQATGSRMGNRAPQVMATSAVRRLTPTECERLQGFPDGWTDIPYRGKPAADGARYKALGNSMAVPCMAYLGERIAAVLDEGLAA